MNTPQPTAVDPRLGAELLAVAGVLEQQGHLVASDGNISVRLPGDRFLITPSGARKSKLCVDDLVVCDMDGQPIPGSSAVPSSEVRMHVRLYEARPEIAAVVHAHPRALVALSLARRPLAVRSLPEVVAGIGLVGYAPYATPGSDGLGLGAAKAGAAANAIVLERHGAVTVGGSLKDALFRMERLAWAADVSLMGHAVSDGSFPQIPHDELERLLGHYEPSPLAATAAPQQVALSATPSSLRVPVVGQHAMRLTSPAFEDGAPLPRRYSADGLEVSPPFAMHNVPALAQSLALVCVDADTQPPWTHWLLYGLCGSCTRVAEGIANSGVVVGTGMHGLNGFDRLGYGGPCPPAGSNHRYVFSVVALRSAPALRPGLRLAEWQAATNAEVLASASVTAVYGATTL